MQSVFAVNPWAVGLGLVKQSQHEMLFNFTQLQSLAAVTVLAGLWLGGAARAAAGVTVITHGLNGNVTGWLTGMATNMPAGQTVVLQSSPDLQTWTALATNTLTISRWDFTNTPPSISGTRYYRGMLP